MALVPFNLYYGEERGDNFTTATQEGRQAAEAANYRCVRNEGSIFNTQMPGSVPLRLYYGEERGDNFTTATQEGRQAAEAAGYKFVRIEGYIAPSNFGQAQLLTLEGTAVLNDAYLDGRGVNVSYQLVLQNKTSGPVTITRANLFYLSEGGWLEGGKELISEYGDFYGEGPTIGSHARHTFSKSGKILGGPVTHIAFQLNCNNATNSQVLFKSIAIEGSGSLNNDDVNHPIFIGLQEPVEVVPVGKRINGQQPRWLTIMLQLVNGTGKPQTVKGLTLRFNEKKMGLPINFFVNTDNGWISESMQNSTALTPTFLYTEVVFSWIQGTKADIAIETTVEGHCQNLQRSVHAYNVVEWEIPRIHPPIKGQWSWNNGPASVSGLNTHSNPGNKYSYDLVIKKAGKTYDNDGKDNDDHYCWNPPQNVYCMADGKVMEALDNVPDNKGNTGKLPDGTKPPGNSRVVIEHDFNGVKYYSVYAHVRQDSIPGHLEPTAGSPNPLVKAGEPIGLVGNAGYTSGPHLHLGFYRKDKYGRIRSRPLFFTDLKSLTGEPIFGTPQGNVEYIS